MTSTGDVELRAAIKFCVGLDKTPSETLKMLESSKTTKKCCKALVFKWHKRFREGRDSIEDDERCGRPSKVRISMSDKVKDLVYRDRRHTLRSLSAELGISTSTVHDILKQDLGMSKVCARWVPRLLKDHERETRVRCSEEFVRRVEQEGDTFLDRIVTTDETWMYHFDPETKAQSCVWKTPGTPPPTKARLQKSGGKHMFMFFMDRKGMILQHQIPDGQTVTAAYYSKVSVCVFFKKCFCFRYNISI